MKLIKNYGADRVGGVALSYALAGAALVVVMVTAVNMLQPNLTTMLPKLTKNLKTPN